MQCNCYGYSYRILFGNNDKKKCLYVFHIDEYIIGVTTQDMSEGQGEQSPNDAGGRPRLCEAEGGYSRDSLYIASFAWIQCSLQHMAKASFAFWNFLGFFFLYSQSEFGCIRGCGCGD